MPATICEAIRTVKKLRFKGLVSESDLIDYMRNKWLDHYRDIGYSETEALEAMRAKYP